MLEFPDTKTISYFREEFCFLSNSSTFVYIFIYLKLNVAFSIVIINETYARLIADVDLCII